MSIILKAAFLILILSLAALGSVFGDDAAEFYLTGVSPSKGTGLGGTRLHIDGNGFTTDFFAARNTVHLCQSNRYSTTNDPDCVECKVIEGACTVDCGGPRRIVCDTEMWKDGHTWSGSMDVVVTIRRDLSFYTRTLQKAFVYFANNVHPLRGEGFGNGRLPNGDIAANWWSQGPPVIHSLSKRAATAEDAVTIYGDHLGSDVKDYTNIYAGVGRPPLGGNINNNKIVTHAVCRPQALNMAADPITGKDDGPSVPVMAEEYNPSPITKDQIKCEMGDFEAGSYNITAIVGSRSRPLVEGAYANQRAHRALSGMTGIDNNM